MTFVPSPEQCADKGYMLSGTHYISAAHTEHLERDGTSVRNKNRIKLPYQPNPEACDHELEVCTHCYESWTFDYALFLARTGGGRALAEQLGDTPENLFAAARDRHIAWQKKCDEAFVALQQFQGGATA